jgi:hypothetical protein
MSQENVEIIRRHYEAFNRRDLDTVAQYHHPDIEVYPGAVGPDTDTGSRGRFRGRAEVPYEVDTKIFDLYTFRDGLIVRGDGFLGKAEALQAAGLSEQDAHADP